MKKKVFKKRMQAPWGDELIFRADEWLCDGEMAKKLIEYLREQTSFHLDRFEMTTVKPEYPFSEHKDQDHVQISVLKALQGKEGIHTVALNGYQSIEVCKEAFLLTVNTLYMACPAPADKFTDGFSTLGRRIFEIHLGGMDKFDILNNLLETKIKMLTFPLSYREYCSAAMATENGVTLKFTE